MNHDKVHILSGLINSSKDQAASFAQHRRFWKHTEDASTRHFQQPPDSPQATLQPIGQRCAFVKVSLFKHSGQLGRRQHDAHPFVFWRWHAVHGDLFLRLKIMIAFVGPKGVAKRVATRCRKAAVCDRWLRPIAGRHE